MEQKKITHGMYKNVNVPISVLNAFIVVGLIMLFTITVAAVILKTCL